MSFVHANCDTSDASYRNLKSNVMEDHLDSTNTESAFEMGSRSSVLEEQVSEGCADMPTESSRSYEAGATVEETPHHDSLRIVDTPASDESCDNVVNNPIPLKDNALCKVGSRQLIRNVDVECISEQEVCQENLQIQNPSECPSKLNNNIALECPLVAVGLGDVKNEGNIICSEQRNDEIRDGTLNPCHVASNEFSTVNKNNGDQFLSEQTKHGEVKKNGAFSIKGGEEKQKDSCVSVSEVPGIIENKLHEPDGELLENNNKSKEGNGETGCDAEQLVKKVLKTAVDESSVKNMLESRNNILESSQVSVQITPKNRREKKDKSYEEVPGKKCSVSPSQDSQTRKSPVFQRGIFPRIVLRNSNAKTGRWLGRQLFQKRETREAKTVESEDARHSFEGLKNKKVSNKKLGMKNKLAAENNLSNLEKEMKCSSKEMSSINDIQLKHLRVSLKKIDENMLINYTVHLPHSQSCVGDNDKLDVSLSSFKMVESSDRNTELVPQVVFASDNAVDKQMLDLQLMHSTQDSVKHNEEKSKNSNGATELSVGKSVSNPKGTNKTSDLENSADTLIEKENVNGSKRRVSEEAYKPSVKKQKQQSPYESMLKKARVHILKIDNAVLSKYGYDSQMLKTANTALVPCLSTTNSSTVKSGRDTSYSWKTYNINQSLLNPNLKKHSAKMDMQSVTSSKMKRKNKFVSKITRRGTVFPLSSRLSLKKLHTRGGAKGKSNCINLKIAQVILRRIEDAPLSSLAVLRKSPRMSTVKSVGRIETIVKSDCSHLKAAELNVGETEDLPLSSYVLPKKLHTRSTPKTMSVTESTIEIAKADSNIFSMELTQERLSSKKRIVFDQTKFCENIQKGKEEALKRNESSCEGNIIVNDCSKENICLNDEPVHLKHARVSLCKLDNLTMPKFLSSNSVVLKT